MPNEYLGFLISCSCPADSNSKYGYEAESLHCLVPSPLHLLKVRRRSLETILSIKAAVDQPNSCMDIRISDPLIYAN